MENEPNISTTMEVSGRTITGSDSYSRYYSKSYEPSGAPKGFDLEAIFGNPQANIDNIYNLSKYYYHKYGIIMRVINIVRDFGVSGYKLNFPKKDERTKKIITRYNKRINAEQVLRDMIFELAQTGNLAGYDRDGKRVDIYPVTQIEVSSLIKNNKPVLIYKNDIVFDDLVAQLNIPKTQLAKKIEISYPKEVSVGIKKNQSRIVLDVDKTFFCKVNSSRYEAYGVPFHLTAFDELAHKTVLKEAERSTAMGIIDKILRISVGDKDHAPTQKEIDFYSSLFDGKRGSIRTTVPHFVNVEWIEPDTSIFGTEKFEQVDQDILNALGVSLTLIRGEGGGNYSEGFIAVTGLIKTIENLRSEIPVVMEQLYKAELMRNGINPENAPEFVFNPVEIDKSAKIDLLKYLFTTAGLPYEVLYEETGFDYGHIKLIREDENTEKVEEVFKSRAMPAFGEESEEDAQKKAEDPEGKGGRPEKNLTERKTDKKQSNNNQPRPSKAK